jgi:hypothetical protein
MKVAAKLAELFPLTHKFSKRSYVGIFWNERTRYTPLDPKLMFWVALHHFIMTRKSVQNEAKLRWNISQRKYPIHSFGPKTHVLGHFAPFRYSMKVGAKGPNWCH